MVPALLLILTLLLAITWGVSHEQRDLRDRALAQLETSGVDTENYQIRFSGRDAYIYGKNISEADAGRIREIIASIRGVRKVHNVTESSGDKNSAQDDNSPDPAIENNQQITPQPDSSEVVRNQTLPESTDNPAKGDQFPVTVADASEKLPAGNLPDKEQLQYQLDGFLMHGAFLFPPGSLIWPPDMQQVLIETAGFLNYNPGLKIEIAGFSEPVRNAGFAKQLSELRAQQVRDQLIYLGVDATRLVSKGYGFDQEKLGRYTMPSSIRFIVQGDNE